MQSFAPHIDAAFPPSGLTADGTDLEWDVSNGTTVSRLTVLMYLNDDFCGGETVFYAPANHHPKANQEQVDTINSIKTDSLNVTESMESTQDNPAEIVSDSIKSLQLQNKLGAFAYASTLPSAKEDETIVSTDVFDLKFQNVISNCFDAFILKRIVFFSNRIYILDNLFRHWSDGYVFPYGKISYSWL